MVAAPAMQMNLPQVAPDGMGVPVSVQTGLPVAQLMAAKVQGLGPAHCTPGTQAMKSQLAWTWPRAPQSMR